MNVIYIYDLLYVDLFISVRNIDIQGAFKLITDKYVTDYSKLHTKNHKLPTRRRWSRYLYTDNQRRVLQPKVIIAKQDALV